MPPKAITTSTLPPPSSGPVPNGYLLRTGDPAAALEEIEHTFYNGGRTAIWGKGGQRTETIFAALISAGAATLVCLVNNIFQQRKTEALLTYKLDELTKRVDKHNSLVERTYRLEEKTSVFDEKMRVANHRIADLEEHTGCACKNL